MAEILLRNLHKRFDDFVAVHDSSLLIEDRKFVVLLGPSGCGKTTTLRMIAGLELPTSGQIRLGGQDVTALRPRQRDIAMVFQYFALYQHLDVRGNLAFPLENEGLPKKAIQARVAEAASIVRIDHLLGARISSLSGGDRQRVALGRALVRKPQAFLMDEPLGTLDAEFRELMCVELRKLHDRLGATTVLVTHDQSEAMAMADHIVVMNQGRTLQADSPAGIYNYPQHKFVAEFVGRPPMNFLPVEGPVGKGATEVRVCGGAVEVPRTLVGAESAWLAVRPEHVDLDAGGRLRGRVELSEYFGSHWVVTVETAGGPLKVVCGKHELPAAGENVRLTLRTPRVVLFERTSGLLVANTATSQHRPEMRHG